MMSNEEICREYRTAKYHSKMIQVLADMNCTDRKTILKILVENGEKVDGRLLRGLKTEAQEAGKAGGDGLPKASAPEETADPSAAEGGQTNKHTHTAGGAHEEPRAEFVTVQDLIVLLREIPGECRVDIGENPLVGYVLIHGFNALSGEHLQVLRLVGAGENV